LKTTLYPTTFQKIVQASQYTQYILSANDKQYCIYTGSQSGEFIQRLLSGKPFERPQTIDVITSLCSGLEISPTQLVIHDVEDGVYFCKLFFLQKLGQDEKILEIDARPSDGLALALIHNFPVFSTFDLLEKIETEQI
jgi:bifunctional DNase/RNase